jgi:hypothetical protein
VIKQNPEAFFKVMNEAAQVQHERVKEDLEKSATQAKDQLVNMGIKVGLSDQVNVQFVAFIDMMDPVSHEFLKVAFRVMREKRDVSFRLIPLIINGVNSEVMARFVLSANMQKSGNMMQFLEHFSDKVAQMTRAKLLDTAKQAGFDVSLIERGEGDKKVEDDLSLYMKTAESMKVQGTPTVYVLHRNGKMGLVPPMDVSGFLELAQTVRSEKSEAPEGKSVITPSQSQKDTKPLETKPVEAKKEEVAVQQAVSKPLGPVAQPIPATNVPKAEQQPASPVVPSTVKQSDDKKPEALPIQAGVAQPVAKAPVSNMPLSSTPAIVDTSKDATVVQPAQVLPQQTKQPLQQPSPQQQVMPQAPVVANSTDVQATLPQAVPQTQPRA